MSNLFSNPYAGQVPMVRKFVYLEGGPLVLKDAYRNILI